jgi:hypothetical protein
MEMTPQPHARPIPSIMVKAPRRKTSTTPDGGKKRMTIHPKKVALPNVFNVGSMTMSSEATQNATEHRKRILRSRALKWSRNGGSFLFFLGGVEAVAVVLVFCSVGELPLCDSFSCVELLGSRSSDMVFGRDVLRTQRALEVAASPLVRPRGLVVRCNDPWVAEAAGIKEQTVMDLQAANPLRAETYLTVMMRCQLPIFRSHGSTLFREV